METLILMENEELTQCILEQQNITFHMQEKINQLESKIRMLEEKINDLEWRQKHE
jgi:uncharacterized protein YlxW (UPF0749 family)